MSHILSTYFTRQIYLSERESTSKGKYCVLFTKFLSKMRKVNVLFYVNYINLANLSKILQHNTQICLFQKDRQKNYKEVNLVAPEH